MGAFFLFRNKLSKICILWLLKSENNFPTDGGVGFLRQNISLFWSSFLICWAISNFWLYFRVWDICLNITLYQTNEHYNVKNSRYLVLKPTKSSFFMTGFPWSEILDKRARITYILDRQAFFPGVYIFATVSDVPAG